MISTPNSKFLTVEEYFSALAANTGKILKELRKTIKKAAPQAEELISYNMPAFRLQGMLVWYAAFREHIGFFPRPSAISKFKEELSGYKVSKGTIRFPIDKPLPLGLISRIVKFRVKENLEKARMKRNKK